MVLQWSDSARDSYIAPEMSIFTRASIPDLSGQAGAQTSHQAVFILNTAIGGGVTVQGKQLLFNAIRRTHSAFESYERARQRTIRHLDAPQERVLEYVQAIDAWEATLGHSWQAARLVAAAAGIKWYEKGDGSKFERLNGLHNTAKHADDLILNHALHDESPIGVWLNNSGLQSLTQRLTFGELAEVLTLLGDFSKIACDPKRLPETVPRWMAPLVRP